MEKKTPRPLVLQEQEEKLPEWNQADADSFAAFADEIFAPIYPYLVQDIRSVLGHSLDGLRVLEIGGGVGNMALELLRAGVTSLDALDVSPAMLEKTRRRLEAFPEVLPRFKTHNGDAGSLPFQNGLFDVVFSRGSIQFWPDIPAALHEMKRVLQPRGLVYVGGGFGLSTPTHLKKEIFAERERRMAERSDLKPIPSLNHAEILELVRKIGGQANTIMDGNGFWLQWFPGKTA